MARETCFECLQIKGLYWETLCLLVEYDLVLGRARTLIHLGNAEYRHMLLASSSSSQNETLFPKILVLSEAGP